MQMPSIHFYPVKVLFSQQSLFFVVVIVVSKAFCFNQAKHNALISSISGLRANSHGVIFHYRYGRSPLVIVVFKIHF